MASEDINEAQDALDTMKADWKALLLAESAYAMHPASCKAVEAMRWRHFKAIRLLFLMAEELEWVVKPELQQFIRDMFQGLPDTKVIEDTHQRLRDLARQNRNFVSSRVKRMFSCMTSGMLEPRHVKILDPVNKAVVSQSWNQLRRVKLRLKTQTRGLKLKDTKLQMIMHPKTQASTTPEAMFTMAAATEWVFHYWKLPGEIDCTLDQAWQSALLNRFDIVRHIPSQKVFMVVASTEYAFQKWNMDLLPGKQDVWILEVLGQSQHPSLQPLKIRP